ncbi:MAG: hypothetical protein FRX49_12232 [Trebouxia sp. A1-2]|nr:MAG: hypothetical protein FRX49_12232 [Trebouxia sp. A1-2]
MDVHEQKVNMATYVAVMAMPPLQTKRIMSHQGRTAGLGRDLSGSVGLSGGLLHCQVHISVHLHQGSATLHSDPYVGMAVVPNSHAAAVQGPGNKLCRWTNQRATLLGKRELQKGSLPGSLMPDHSDDRSSK